MLNPMLSHDWRLETSVVMMSGAIIILITLIRATLLITLAWVKLISWSWMCQPSLATLS